MTYTTVSITGLQGSGGLYHMSGNRFLNIHYQPANTSRPQYYTARVVDFTDTPTVISDTYVIPSGDVTTYSIHSGFAYNSYDYQSHIAYPVSATQTIIARGSGATGGILFDWDETGTGVIRILGWVSLPAGLSHPSSDTVIPLGSNRYAVKRGGTLLVQSYDPALGAITNVATLAMSSNCMTFRKISPGVYAVYSHAYDTWNNHTYNNAPYHHQWYKFAIVDGNGIEDITAEGVHNNRTVLFLDRNRYWAVGRRNATFIDRSDPTRSKTIDYGQDIFYPTAGFAVDEFIFVAMAHSGAGHYRFCAIKDVGEGWGQIGESGIQSFGNHTSNANYWIEMSNFGSHGETFRETAPDLYTMYMREGGSSYRKLEIRKPTV